MRAPHGKIKTLLQTAISRVHATPNLGTGPRSTMLCAQYLLQSHTQSGDAIRPLPCRRWTCEYCQPKRHRQLIAIALSGQPNKMLTLTVNPAVGETPTERRRLLHNAWRTLHKRMCRRTKTKAIPYIAFVERTKQGEPHLHILMRCKYIPFKWYRANMRKLIRAPHVHIKKVSSQARAAFYVTKYCTKEPAQFGTQKRYWLSRNYQIDDSYQPEHHPQERAITGRIRENFQTFIDARLHQGWSYHVAPDGWWEFTHPTKPHTKSGAYYYSPQLGRIAISGLPPPIMTDTAARNTRPHSPAWGPE